MNSMSFKHLLTGFAMLAAGGAAIALTPSVDQNASSAVGNLATVIPEEFASWVVDKSIVPIEPAPDVQNKLSNIYSQTLARTYINRKNGERIMLSVAYGSDQSKNTQMHRPDVCYTAQGFQVFGGARGVMATQYGNLPVKRLVAIQGLRHEAITYWMVVGDQAVYSGSEQRWAQLRYGLTGKVVGGILVRISSLDVDDKNAFKMQESFVMDMISVLADADRDHLIGKVGA